MKRVLISSSVAVVACSALGVSIGGDTDPAASSGRQRAGDRMAAYLGTDISPAAWARELRSAGRGITECEQEFARQDASGDRGYTDADQLRFVDRERFESTFGYGVVQSVQDRRAEKAAASPLPPPAQVESHGCMDAVDWRIRELSAPAEVWQRVGQLLQTAAQRPEYVDAAGSWKGCMMNRGYEVDDPLAVSGLVQDRLAAKELAAGVPMHVIEDDPEHQVALSTHELQQVAAYELKLFQADRVCHSSSGLDDVMFDLESGMLGVLQAEFPDFDGVYHES